MNRKRTRSLLVLAAAVMPFAGGDEGMTIRELAAKASSVYGEPVFFDAERARVRTKIRAADLELPPDRFAAAFEAKLFQEGFIDVDRYIGRVHAHSIVPLSEKREGNELLKSASHLVGRIELEALRDRITHVTAIVYCHGAPANEVEEKILPLLVEPQREDVRPLEGSDALVVSGFAKTLASLESTLTECGAEFAALDDVEEEPPSAPSSEAPLVVEGGRDALARILAATSRAICEPVFFDPSDLAREPTEFAGTIRVDRANALEWLDAALGTRRFVRTSCSIGGARVHAIVGRERRWRSKPRWVEPDELAACDGELVAIAALTEHFSARDVVDTFCCRFGEFTYDAVRNIEGSPALVIGGPADKVRFALRIARELDRHASPR